VPTVRTSVHAGEVLNLKVIILSERAAQDAGVYWRPMGQSSFAVVPLQHVARGVFSITFPAAATADDFEYYVRVKPVGGSAAFFPATAPRMNQTVVVIPR
jgi:hypothetical protein